jgi:hypothetical protein
MLGPYNGVRYQRAHSERPRTNQRLPGLLLVLFGMPCRWNLRIPSGLGYRECAAGRTSEEAEEIYISVTDHPDDRDHEEVYICCSATATVAALWTP